MSVMPMFCALAMSKKCVAESAFISCASRCARGSTTVTGLAVVFRRIEMSSSKSSAWPFNGVSLTWLGEQSGQGAVVAVQIKSLPRDAALVKPARAGGGFDAFAHVSFGLHGQNQAMFRCFHISSVEPILVRWFGLVVVAVFGWKMSRVAGRFNGWKRTAAAWPAGDCPFAETINGCECDRHAMLVEPFGDLAVSPMFAAQAQRWLRGALPVCCASCAGFRFRLVIANSYLLRSFQPQ